jgi:hypothetical protein
MPLEVDTLFWGTEWAYDDGRELVSGFGEQWNGKQL